MPTLREVRTRITGVKKTQKITRAMKMVSAAKLRRAQTAVVTARPYAASLRTLMGHLVAHTDTEHYATLVPRPVLSVVLVVVTSDRGMCGAFNTNVIKATQARLETEYAVQREAGRVRLVCIGKKGSDFFRKNGYPVARAYPGIFQGLKFPAAQEIARLLTAMYVNGEVDRVDLIYNEFKNVAQQRIVVDQYLPVPAEAVAGGESHAAGADYIYEPEEAAILSALIPRFLDFRIWRTLLESNAAEEGARMTAMDNATENANEMINTLQLQYNKARQGSITKELLEIVGGAEALTQG